MWRKGQALWHTFQTVPPKLRCQKAIEEKIIRGVVTEVALGAKRGRQSKRHYWHASDRIMIGWARRWNYKNYCSYVKNIAGKYRPGDSFCAKLSMVIE